MLDGEVEERHQRGVSMLALLSVALASVPPKPLSPMFRRVLSWVTPPGSGLTLHREDGGSWRHASEFGSRSRGWPSNSSAQLQPALLRPALKEVLAGTVSLMVVSSVFGCRCYASRGAERLPAMAGDAVQLLDADRRPR